MNRFTFDSIVPADQNLHGDKSPRAYRARASGYFNPHSQQRNPIPSPAQVWLDFALPNPNYL